MIIIELDICWLNDEQESLVNATGKDIPFSESEYKKNTFYKFDCIYPSDEKGFTCIFVGGEHFVAKISYDNLQKLIQNQLTFKYN